MAPSKTKEFDLPNFLVKIPSYKYGQTSYILFIKNIGWVKVIKHIVLGLIPSRILNTKVARNN